MELISPNQRAAGLKVLDGAFRPRGGGLVMGAIPVSLTETSAVFAFTGDELEVEVYQG